MNPKKIEHSRYDENTVYVHYFFDTGIATIKWQKTDDPSFKEYDHTMEILSDNHDLTKEIRQALIDGEDNPLYFAITDAVDQSTLENHEAINNHFNFLDVYGVVSLSPCKKSKIRPRA